MKRITIEGESYALPFADLVRPHTPSEWADLEASIGPHNPIRYPVQTYLSETWGRCLLDGYGRATIAEAKGLECPLSPMRCMSDEEARREACVLNFARRQLTDAERANLQRIARGERIPRVKAATDAGHSLRTIAAAEGVSPEQVRRDLAVAVTPIAAPIAAPIAVPTGGPYRRVTIPQRAHNQATGLLSAVKRVMAKPGLAGQLRATAESYGVPLGEGNCWPAADAVAATLRDLAKPSVTPR